MYDVLNDKQFALELIKDALIQFAEHAQFEGVPEIVDA
jgi:hypothetical protein